MGVKKILRNELKGKKPNGVAVREAERLALGRTEEWYFSAAGKKEYKRAQTLAEKTMYFYWYLRDLEVTPDTRRVRTFWGTCEELEKRNKMLTKIAFVMAKAVDGSSLPYGSYPDILKADKNPLVKYCKNRASNTHALLCDVLGIKVEDKNEPVFDKLTHCEGEPSDIYKLERYLIWALHAKPLNKVYGYSLANAAKQQEEDESDE